MARRKGRIVKGLQKVRADLWGLGSRPNGFLPGTNVGFRTRLCGPQCHAHFGGSFFAQETHGGRARFPAKTEGR
jgi:hypothetical protein